MTWYQWTIAILIVFVFLFVATLYGTGKDVWNAGNSCYVPEGK